MYVQLLRTQKLKSLPPNRHRLKFIHVSRTLSLCLNSKVDIDLVCLLSDMPVLYIATLENKINDGMFICVRGLATHVVRRQKTLQTYGFPINRVSFSISSRGGGKATIADL